MQSGLLSTLIWLPILGGIAVLALGDRRLSLARWVALATSVLTFALSIPLYTGFDTTTSAFQFVEQLPWIPAFNANYHLGVDGISLPLVLLTTFVTIPVVVAAWTVITERPAQYFAAFLIMEGLMVGVFSALDALLFYFFWEAMLIPMFLIIGIWGGPRRVYATLKFFLYTFLGSVLMLVALIYMYLQAGSYDIVALQELPLGYTEQFWIFLAFFAAFAVKIPMFPVHTWLPDARRSADRRLGGSGGHHAENGWIWILEIRAAHRARCRSGTRHAHHRALAHRGGLHRLRRARADGHEETHCVFVDRAHGLRDARLLSGL
jgi:NADH-quinone oxidoreductase subunit M